MGDRALSFVFPHLYYLFSLKNRTISDFRGFENFVSISFGFCRHLSSRETTEVVSLLPLLDY